MNSKNLVEQMYKNSIPHKANVDTEAPVDSIAINAKKDTICNRSPHRILRIDKKHFLIHKNQQRFAIGTDQIIAPTIISR